MTASQQEHTTKHEHHELVDLYPSKEHTCDSLHLSSQQIGKEDCRHSLAKILNSYRFHIVILVLVAIDCLLVFGELIIDLRLFQNPTLCQFNSTDHQTESESHHTLETVEKIFHYSSISLLGLFVVEVFLKLIAFGYKFFYKFEELIDATIIIVSFVLDIVFINNGFLKFMGVLIFLRLWRIVRIVHAIITAVQTPMQHKIEVEERRSSLAESKLKEALQEIEILKGKLLLYYQQGHPSIESLNSVTGDKLRRLPQ